MTLEIPDDLYWLMFCALESELRRIQDLDRTDKGEFLETDRRNHVRRFHALLYLLDKQQNEQKPTHNPTFVVERGR